MTFPQDILRNHLIEKAGKKLTHSAKSVEDITTEQIQLIRENIASFFEINKDLDSINTHINEVVSNMDQTVKVTLTSSDKLESVSEKMNELEEKFESINDLLKTINTIADQTNLLALNATIEAARAGEYGRGFAVVASEVKELSRTTKQSNEQIQNTLGSIGEAITLLAQAIKLTKEQMQQTLMLVNASEKNVVGIKDKTTIFNHQVNHSLQSFQKLENSSDKVENEIRELGTIGETFTFMLELMVKQGLFKSKFNPLDRLEPLLKESSYSNPDRFKNNEKEIILSDDDILISATDSRGVIQFANNRFYEVAEYDYGALINKAHNIIRHPDMPKTAFADLWQTIKNGEMWHGLVLNRSKNGRSYWVDALTFPCFSNGQITGYISVRSKPERSQIERAKMIYRKLE